MGLMIGVEFVKDQKTRQPDEDLRDSIIHLAFQNGLLLLGCGKSTIRISPPLSINQAEIDQGLAIFEDVISQAEQPKEITHVA
jgi:4-aminobutyrate aminotransferase